MSNTYKAFLAKIVQLHPQGTVKLSRVTATKPTSQLNKSTRLAKTFLQFEFSTLSCQTNQQVEWILD